MGSIRREAVDRVVARIASRQRGLIAHEQLVELGLDRSAIRRRLRAGRLHRVHRGVYAVGHPLLTPLAEELAVLMSCCEATVISRASSLYRWKLLDARPSEIHATVTKGRKRPLRGVRLHQGQIPGREIRRVDGLRLTSPALSLLDAAPDLPPAELELALGRARSRHLVRPSHFEVLRAWQPRRRGWRALGELLEAEAAPDFSRSHAEVLAHSLLRDAGFTGIRRNVRMFGFEHDFWIPDYELVVEVDGYAYHGRRRAFDRDHRRDAAIRGRGLEVWRLSWEQLTKARARTLGELIAWRTGRSPQAPHDSRA